MRVALITITLAAALLTPAAAPPARPAARRNVRDRSGRLVGRVFRPGQPRRVLGEDDPGHRTRDGRSDE